MREAEDLGVSRSEGLGMAGSEKLGGPISNGMSQARRSETHRRGTHVAYDYTSYGKSKNRIGVRGSPRKRLPLGPAAGRGGYCRVSVKLPVSIPRTASASRDAASGVLAIPSQRGLSVTPLVPRTERLL